MRMEFEAVADHKSLYEQFKTSFDKLGVYHPNVAEMAKHFPDAQSMERALCYGPSVISKWVKNSNGISKEAERRAGQWLENMHGVTEESPAEEVKKDDGVMLIVTCPTREIAEKCQRLLSVLSCEVAEV